MRLTKRTIALSMNFGRLELVATEPSKCPGVALYSLLGFMFLYNVENLPRSMTSQQERCDIRSVCLCESLYYKLMK